MREDEKDNKKMTINDVAEHLGVSISTVSRAISGKGRIGRETRKRVLEFIEAHDYHPNSSAKSLAQSKTNNIALVIPEAKTLVMLPFYYSCICGVVEVAQARDYDMFAVTVQRNDVSGLKRLIDNNKVDGIILGSTYEEDAFAGYLKVRSVPFVTIGSLDDEDIVQIDHDNRGACRDLTAILLSRKLRRIAFLGTADHLIVNKDRYDGYRQAYRDAGAEIPEDIVFRNNMTESLTRKNVDSLLDKDIDCILCQDDDICNTVLLELRQKGVDVPERMRVASCHNSKILDNYPVSVTSLRFDNAEIGRAACRVLLDMLEGKKVPHKTELDYEVVLKESTK